MTRVVWTPEAISRLDDIEAHIALDSPINAKEVIARLLTRTRQLEAAALSGREVPEYRCEDIRDCSNDRIVSSIALRPTVPRSCGDALPPITAAQG